MIQTPADVAAKILSISFDYGKEKKKDLLFFTCDVFETFPTGAHYTETDDLSMDDPPSYIFQTNAIYHKEFSYPFHQFNDELREKYLNELRFDTVDRRVLSGELASSFLGFDRPVNKTSILSIADVAAASSILAHDAWPEFQLSLSLHPKGSFQERSFYAFDYANHDFKNFAEGYNLAIENATKLEMPQ